MEKYSFWVMVLISPLALGYAVTTGDWLTAFWVAFPVLPLVGIASLLSPARFRYALIGYVFLLIAEGIVDPFAALGQLLNTSAMIGAVPRATGLGVVTLGVLLLLVCVGVWRKTFGSMIASIGLAAFIGVVTMFHLVLITGPFEAARADLDARASQWSQEPCGEGCVNGLATEVLSAFEGLERLAWTMEDIKDVEAVLFCWIESDITLAGPARDVCLSKQAEIWEVRVAPSGIGVYVGGMRQGFALLSLAFMSAWGFGVSYIIRRHGNMRWRRGRWVKFA